MDDRDLLDRCLRRAPGAWEEFLRLHRGGIEAAARAALARAVGPVSMDDVEAVVEGVLLALVKDDHAALRRFAGESTLGGYLRAIATKVALNHVRTEMRKGWLRFKPLEEVAEPMAPGVADEEAPGSEAVKAALDALPARDRLILKLFHFDGASYKEIARVMGIPMNAVSPTLIRARKKLRVLFGRGR
ncbi:MAG: sigma-70 family RNA polymerase sigma factor [Planctomycetes bacterium]|nr:sigma-70 family RNA polymerase sigma factor [Planctomycetota bacterium]